MAVILTDMDMPACCAVCEFRHPFANIGYLCKRKPDKPFVPNGLRPEWCPIEPTIYIDDKEEKKKECKSCVEHNHPTCSMRSIDMKEYNNTDSIQNF